MRIAVCPGSFDPVTLGHLDIITRASKLFDKVIVLISVNYNKKTSSFTTEERAELIKKCTSNITNLEIDILDGLLADYVKKCNASVIVKGLRAVSDFEYEFQMAMANKNLYSKAETIFLTTSSEYMFLSSSVVKQIAYFGGDISKFIPVEIVDTVTDRLRKDNKNE